ncbi:hypothetical protein GCM10015536_64500 [Streptomyces griseomycini]|nr:hypothetical protein GCM10015536_64500 [Streptomyces griseomycini]
MLTGGREPAGEGGKPGEPLTGKWKGSVAVMRHPGNVAQRPRNAAPGVGTSPRAALEITLGHRNAARTATVRSGSSRTCRPAVCPRGELPANDTLVVTQERLDLIPGIAGFAVR